jgi:hypothetical protein
MARRRNPRRNPSKAVYIGTGIAAALGVLYLLMKKDETSGGGSDSSGGKSTEQDITESGAGASAERRAVTKQTLAARMDSPTVYDADGSVYTVTRQEAANLVASGRGYMYNATRTAVIHKSQVR